MKQVEQEIKNQRTYSENLQQNTALYIMDNNYEY